MYNAKIKQELEGLLDDFEHTREIMDQNLKQVLKENQNTEYGKKYQFSEIHSAEEYRQRISLNTYLDFESYLKKINEGKENILYSYKTCYHLISSGTTSDKKMLVLTDEALKRFSCYTFYMPYYILSDQDAAGSFFTGFFNRPGAEEQTILSSAYHYNLYKTGWITEDTFSGGAETVFMDETEDLLYFKAWIALAQEEIHDFLTVFLYDLIRFFQYLECNWMILLEDMRNGKVNERSTLPAEKKALLEKRFRITEERRQLLETEFSKGFEGVVERVWPQVRFVNGIGGKDFHSQEVLVRYYIGKLPMIYFSYAASECILGVPLEPDKAEYALLPRSAFYEFIRQRDGKVLELKDVEIGEEYELVVTTFTGLYRYRLGDVVKVNYFKGETPVVEVVGRALISNVSGEKMDIRKMRELTARVLAKFGESDAEYSVGVDTNVFPYRYIAFYESTTSENADRMSKELDRLLREKNSDYNDLRRLQSFSETKMLPVRKDSHRKCVYVLSGLSHKKPIVRLKKSQINFLKGYLLDE